MMEQIAATLQKLGTTQKKQFVEYLNRRVSEAQEGKERQSLENLAGHLGLLLE
jgi:hypothetical protein